MKMYHPLPSNTNYMLSLSFCLFLPFFLDDNLSAGSGMEMDDRLSHLEQRVQLQEDEIQLLKAALADALRRLGYCEELTQASSRKGAPTKGQHSSRHLLLALPVLGMVLPASQTQ